MNRLILVVLCLLFTRPALAELRVASWNVFNRPNTSAHEADLTTIIDAIGSESVLEHTGRIDILSLSETDQESAQKTVNLFNELYNTTTYELITTSPDGGGDRNGFIYDTSTVALLDSTELSDGLTHNILRGDFRPRDIVGVPDFHVYSVWLKSGSSTSDRAERQLEAEIIRADADALGANAHVLYGGDFNWQRSDNEGAWVVFTREGNGQGFDAYDLSNVGGRWLDNSDFVHLHTQDPRLRPNGNTSRMDDRFDMHFVTEDLFDGHGLEIVQGSYRVFGNDGSHQLNEPITTGTGASPDVLLALASFSDHLPVVTDFKIDDLLIGDIDGDGEVAFNDFLILSRNFGLSEAKAVEGDIDNDQTVEFDDFLFLAGNFGGMVPDVVSVPEPELRSSILICALLLVSIRRRVGNDHRKGITRIGPLHGLSTHAQAVWMETETCCKVASAERRTSTRPGKLPGKKLLPSFLAIWNCLRLSRSLMLSSHTHVPRGGAALSVDLASVRGIHFVTSPMLLSVTWPSLDIVFPVA